MKKTYSIIRIPVQKKPSESKELILLCSLLALVILLLAITFAIENSPKNANPNLTLINCSANDSAKINGEYNALEHTCASNATITIECHYSGCIDNNNSDAKTCAITYNENNKAKVELYNEQPERSEIAHELFHVYQWCSGKFEDDNLAKESTAYLYGTTRSESYYHSPLGYEWLAQGLNQTERENLVWEIFDAKNVTLQWLVERKNYYNGI